MATEKYDLGTPLGGERKTRRRHSPLQEMDVTGVWKDDENPATPAEAIARNLLPDLALENQQLTLASIGALLDQKLAPVCSAVSETKKAIDKLRAEVEENELKLIKKRVFFD